MDVSDQGGGQGEAQAEPENASAYTLNLTESGNIASKKSKLPVINRVKPWVQHDQQKSNKDTTYIRIPLEKINPDEEELFFTPKSADRVVLRLERVMGSSKISLTDMDYLHSLKHHINEEELKTWSVRLNRRMQVEKDRHRTLVVDGIVELEEGDDELRGHPIYRVNRMIRRIRAGNDSEVRRPITGPPPEPITQVEPFTEYERTGILFGNHQDHYARASTIKPISTTKVVETSPIGSLEDFEIVAPSRTGIFRMSGKTSSQLRLEMRSTTDISGMRSRTDVSSFAGNITRSRTDISSDRSEMPMMELSRTKFDKADVQVKATPAEVKALLRRPSTVEQGIEKMKLSPTNLAKQWESVPSKLITDLFSQDHVDDLYNFSSELSSAYQRGQLNADEFITKVHRKLFRE